MRLGMALAGCTEVAREPAVATGTERAADLARVDNGDGTWSKVVAEGFDPDAVIVDGALTWRYDGQARFSWDPKPKIGPRTFIYDGDEPPGVLVQLAASSYQDADGRRWTVAAIDENLLAHHTHRYDADVVDFAQGGVAPVDPNEYQHAIGEIITWEPMSWAEDDCNDLDNDNDYHIWDGESRSVVAGSPNARQKAAVRIESPAANCSGVMLRDLWLLTANHCVYDDSDLLVDADDVYVTMDWIPEGQLGVEAIYPGPNFTQAGSDYDDDYALIKLKSPWSSSYADFDISSVDDATLQAVGANFHNLGFPEWFTLCSTTWAQELVHSANNDLTFFGAETLRWKGDGTRGHSGGPVYYCPEGVASECGVGDDGYVVAVFGGWSPWPVSRFVGARGANFADWAIDIMDTH